MMLIIKLYLKLLLSLLNFYVFRRFFFPVLHFCVASILSENLPAESKLGYRYRMWTNIIREPNNSSLCVILFCFAISFQPSELIISQRDHQNPTNICISNTCTCFCSFGLGFTVCVTLLYQLNCCQ